MAELSPMMRQYFEIKANNEDSILFFRVGDFYEMFYEDAKIASEELDLVLTGKDCGQEERAPMCGVPFHSCEAYISRLVEKGHKVAICEQTEDPATAKGIVKREVIRIITPGTIIEDSMLDEGRNNFLAALCAAPDGIGFCFTDASTGECHATALPEENAAEHIINELARFKPKELLIDRSITEKMKTVDQYLNTIFEGTLTLRPSVSFKPQCTRDLILKHFNVISTENLDIADGGCISAALGAVIEYLYETGVTGNISVNKVEIYSDNQYMRLDMTAIRNLELTETMRSKSKKGSLLWVLDKTRTAMGKRLLRSWVQKPLLSIANINLRLNAVDELNSDVVLTGELSEALNGIRDIERLITKVVYGSANARDLNSLAYTSAKFPTLKGLLAGVNCNLLKEIYDQIDPLEDITELIFSAIADEPKLSVREGGIIRKGYSQELDMIRGDITNGTDFLADIESRERERTGIKTLKVKFNKVFGYYRARQGSRV